MQPFTKLTSTAVAAMLGTTAFVAIALTPAPATAQDHPYCLQGRQWGYPVNVISRATGNARPQLQGLIRIVI